MVSFNVDVSTSVIVNYVYLFTAGTIQITIGTKSLLDCLLVSFPDSRLLWEWKDLFLSCGMLCFSAQVAHYTWMSIIDRLILYVVKLVAYIYYL